MNYLSIAALLGLLSLASCKHNDLSVPPPPDQTAKLCKVTSIDPGLGGANNRTFEYNPQGLITRMTLAFRQVNTTDAVRLNDYRFTYDANNQLAEAKITIDGKTPTGPIYYGIGDTERYVWVDGQLTQIVSTLAGKPLATTSFSYDAQHRLTRAKTVPVSGDDVTYESIYTYDANGSYACLSLADGEQDVYEEYIIDPTTRSVESLLAGHGLPYDVFTFTPWKTAILAEYKAYSFNRAGQKQLEYSYKTTASTKNSQGVVTRQQVEDTNGQRTINFLLADCQ